MDTMSKAWAVLLLFVLPGTVVGFDVEPGAEISLACPQAVSRSQASLETVVEKEKENYLYRYRVSSPSQTPPFLFRPPADRVERKRCAEKLAGEYFRVMSDQHCQASRPGAYLLGEDPSREQR